MIVYDNEGFPFDYKSSACNYGSTPTEPAEQPVDQQIGFFTAQSLLEKRSEAKMSAEYKLRGMLDKFVGTYVTDNSGVVHAQVKFTKNYAVFRYRSPEGVGPCGAELTKYRFPYDSSGIEHCRKLLLGENSAPIINAEYA